MKVKKLGVLLIILVVCVATVLVAWLAANSGSIDVAMGDSSLTVSSANAGSTNIAFNTIQDVELVTSIDIGEMTSGIGNSKISAGEWSLDDYDDYGDCYLFVYNSVSSYIVITTNNKNVIFNCSSVDDTEQLYDEILLIVESLED